MIKFWWRSTSGYLSRHW